MKSKGGKLIRTKTKQNRTRRSGHKHAEFIQDRPYVSPDARKVLAHIMRNTLAMMRVWGGQWEGIEATVAREAIKNYIKKVERSL